MKEKIVQEIIRLGKRHRKLRMPALAAAALFLVMYHSVRNFFLQFRCHPIRQRILVGILTLALLAGQIGIINAVAGSDSVSVTENAEAGNPGSRMLLAFSELPDEIRKQTVPIGTALEELVLPGSLGGGSRADG